MPIINKRGQNGQQFAGGNQDIEGEQMQLVGVAGQGSNEVDADGELMLMEDDEELKEPLDHRLQHDNAMHMPVNSPD